MKYDLKVDANASSFFMKPDLQEYVFDALGDIFNDDLFIDEALNAEEITEEEAKRAEKWNVDNLLTADILEKNVSILVEPCNRDLGSFLKLHYISDYGEFASAYAEYIMDDCELNTVCYCPATQRVIIFEVY